MVTLECGAILATAEVKGWPFLVDDAGLSTFGARFLVCRLRFCPFLNLAVEREFTDFHHKFTDGAVL